MDLGYTDRSQGDHLFLNFASLVWPLARTERTELPFSVFSLLSVCGVLGADGAIGNEVLPDLRKEHHYHDSEKERAIKSEAI
jgi:hypothetical protein